MNKTTSSRQSLREPKADDYSHYSVEEINNFIKTVESHLAISVKEGKFIEADLLKQKLKQLNKSKKEKAHEELIHQQAQRKELLFQEQREELEQFNSRMDQKYNEISQSINDFDTAFNEKAQKELDESIEDFNSSLPSNPKPSKSLIILNNQLDLYVKQANYQAAHDVQHDITVLSEKERVVFVDERQKKIDAEIERIKRRQDNKYKVQKEKLNLIYTEFKKDRAVKVEEMMSKYKSKIKEMDNAHKFELSNFEKFYVGASNQNNRANSRLSVENQKKLSGNDDDK